MRRRIKPLIAALMMGSTVLPMMIAPPAHAQFFGGVVFDPTNYGQNLLTAVRTLQTVNNQIRQLQNEADMLVNDVRNLTRLDFDASAELNRLLGEISDLMDQANAISYEISETDRIFQAQYPEDYVGWTTTEIAVVTEQQWQTSRSAYHDTLLVQSKIVEAVRTDTGLLSDLISASQGAEGNMDVGQAGNQIAALNAKQNMQMQELMAAQYRAEALERARNLQIERESKVRHTAFVGANTAYTRR